MSAVIRERETGKGTPCSECKNEFAVCSLVRDGRTIKPCHLCLPNIVGPADFVSIMRYRHIMRGPARVVADE